LTVQLTADAGRSSELVPADLFFRNRPSSEVAAAFKRAGFTEREMTALAGWLLTLETVQKKRTTEDWKNKRVPSFVNREMGRMSNSSN
jgi:hypothetical protein